MKIKIVLMALLVGVIATGFSPKEDVEGYSYSLEVNSISGKVESFDVKIETTPAGHTESKEVVLRGMQTPFKKNLKSGKHVIKIITNSDQKTVEATVIGLLHDQKQNFASSVNDKIKTLELFAGPNGNCGASQ